MQKTDLKKIVKLSVGIILVIVLIIISLISPIDRTPLKDQFFYKQMVRSLPLTPVFTSPPSPVYIGWSKFGLLPNYPMPMAGYTPKAQYESIHDSLYCRILTIKQASQTVIIISLDLLLFPPIIKEKVTSLMNAQQKKYFLYLGATHTHSGLGGWDKSTLGQLILGKFDEKWTDTISQQIFNGIQTALSTSQKSTLQYWQTDAIEYVENRLDIHKGLVDGKIRGIRWIREDQSTAVMVTYSAHAINTDWDSKIISGDYPTLLNTKLEEKNTFSIFLAGMVGSHRLRGFDYPSFEKIRVASDSLFQKIDLRKSSPLLDSVSLSVAHLPIQFGPSQMRIAKNWKIRDWVFRLFLGDNLNGEITYLKIGNIIMMGMPCDFSGEIFARQMLDKQAALYGKELIITSFNGNYTGYVTDDCYYETSANEEVRIINWVGPYFGQYYTDMITSLIKKED